MKYFAWVFLLFLAACGETTSTSSSAPVTRAIVAHGGGNVWTGYSSGIRLDRAFAEPMRLAGGRSARIVTVSSQETDGNASLRDLFVKSGYRNVYHLNVRDPNAVAEIAQANVIYFDGGVQTRLMRKLNANPTIRDAIRNRYAQGAVVAGVSAGAAALSDLMICCDRGGRAVPSRGIGLLPNVVIDQHYSERNRQFRLDQIISQNPNLIGIGIDEGMAVVFTGEQMRLTGSGGSVTLVRSNNGQNERVRMTSGTVDLGASNSAFKNASVGPLPTIAPNIIQRPIIIDANSALFCQSVEAVKRTIAANEILSLRAGSVANVAGGCTIYRNSKGPYGPLEGRTSSHVATTKDGQQLFVSTTASGEFSYTFIGDG